jgi:hypothetical protein
VRTLNLQQTRRDVIGAVVCQTLLCFSAPPLLAKRAAPQSVAPVVADTVEYSAPHELMGVVVATDRQSRKKLWQKRIYRVARNPALESDVQDVFITSLAIEGNALIIRNERGDQYVLELSTRKVIKRK